MSNYSQGLIRNNGMVASEIIRVGWIQGEYDQADLGTKTTLSTKRRYELVNEIMWNDGFTVLDDT